MYVIMEDVNGLLVAGQDLSICRLKQCHHLYGQCDQMLHLNVFQFFPKVAHNSLDLKARFFKIDQKVTQYLGYYCKTFKKSPNLVTLPEPLVSRDFSERGCSINP